MKNIKPKFWEKINFYSILLIPLSLIYYIILYAKEKYVKQSKFNIPVICVGNIYLGGTGKTPLCIYIANALKKRKITIIRKHYADHKDEYNLIKSKSCFLISKSTREKGIREAENKKFKIALLDDGFQDNSIEKNMNILCFNSNQLIGNGLLLPAGPLRDSLVSIKKAQIIVLNGRKNLNFEKKIYKISNKIKIFYSDYKPINIKQFRNKKLFAFAGIGSPENFFELLKKYKLKLKKKLIFPDHYNFKKDELLDMIQEAEKSNLEIITTEKDYQRIKNYNFKKIKFLKVELEVHKKKQFLDQIISSL